LREPYSLAMDNNTTAARLALSWTSSIDGAEVLQHLDSIPDRQQATALYGAIQDQLSPLHAAELAEAWAGRRAA